jgi:hypothetical protein
MTCGWARAQPHGAQGIPSRTRSILVLRGHRVLLDSAIATLHGVTTKRFNEQVRRNAKRFPADFMFALNAEEISSLRSQIVALKLGRGRHGETRNGEPVTNWVAPYTRLT